MTSSNENIFHVTDHLCGEFTVFIVWLWIHCMIVNSLYDCEFIVWLWIHCMIVNSLYDCEFIVWLWIHCMIVNSLYDCEFIVWLWIYCMIVNSLYDCEFIVWLWIHCVIKIKIRASKILTRFQLWVKEPFVNWVLSHVALSVLLTSGHKVNRRPCQVSTAGSHWAPVATAGIQLRRRMDATWKHATIKSLI